LSPAEVSCPSQEKDVSFKEERDKEREREGERHTSERNDKSEIDERKD